MRTFFTNLLAATIVVAGCQSIELSPSVTDIDNCTSSLSVSTKVTPTHIDAYLNGYKGIPKTRSADVSIDPILNGTDTVMYLVNYPEGGWEVLSADLRLPKVLVQGDNENISLSELYANPSEELIYNNLSGFISELQDNPLAEIETGGDSWSNIATLNIDSSLDGDDLPGIGWLHIGTDIVRDTLVQDHLLKTKWGQGVPWNSKTPYTDSTRQFHCATGCVMVAASQMLYYLHDKIGVPAKTYGDSYVDKFIPDTLNYIILLPKDLTLYSPTYLDIVWDLMPLYAGYEGATSVTYGAVATLMVQLGQYMNAWYRKDGTTSCFIDRIPDCFSQKFGISCTCETYEPDSLYNHIMVNKMPVIINMFGDYGHAAVVDGMKEIMEYTKYTYLRTGVSETIYKYEYEERGKSYMMTINWGYDGEYNNRWYNPYVIHWTSLGTFTSSTQMVLGFKEKE